MFAEVEIAAVNNQPSTRTRKHSRKKFPKFCLVRHTAYFHRPKRENHSLLDKVKELQVTSIYNSRFHNPQETKVDQIILNPNLVIDSPSRRIQLYRNTKHKPNTSLNDPIRPIFSSCFFCLFFLTETAFIISCLCMTREIRVVIFHFQDTVAQMDQ